MDMDTYPDKKLIERLKVFKEKMCRRLMKIAKSSPAKQTFNTILCLVIFSKSF